MDESEEPAAPRFTKSLMELLGESEDKAHSVSQVRLINKHKHSLIHEFGQPLPPEWQWASRAIDKLHKEIDAGSPSELLGHFVSNGGEVAIMQGQNCNDFYEFAGHEHRDRLRRVAFVSQYHSKGEATPHAAIVLMEAPYAALASSTQPKHGDRFFHHGNIVLHELGHAADIHTGPVGQRETHFTGRHSESALFKLTLKLDQLFNQADSFERYVDNKLSREYDTSTSRAHEKIAIASENYHSNKKHPLPPLVQTYFKSVLVSDMAFRADGNTAAMDNLAKGLNKPPLTEIFGSRLATEMQHWLAKGDMKTTDGTTRVLLTNKDLITARLTDYMASAAKIANNAASRGWSSTRT